MTYPPQPPLPPEGGYPPPQGGYPPPPQGGYPPPPQGGYGAPPPQGGYPPPPQGGYPPPQGGYPPPPQGGYGAPPPQGGYPPPPQGYSPQGYPPQGGYGPQGGYPPGGPGYGTGPQVNIGEAFSWAFNKFSKNAVALIVPTIAYAVVLGVVYALITFLAAALATTSTSSYESYGSGFSYSFGAGLGFASIAVTLLGYLVMFVVGGVIASAYYGGLLDIANGQPVQIGSFFKPRNVGSVLIASLIVGIATSIGSLLCIIPGLVVGIFTIFTTVLIVDRNLAPIDAIKASFELVKSNFVQVLLAYLIIGVIVAVGALLCGVGLIVAAPVAMLFLVHTFRTLGGGTLAPQTP